MLRVRPAIDVLRLTLLTGLATAGMLFVLFVQDHGVLSGLVIVVSIPLIGLLLWALSQAWRNWRLLWEKASWWYGVWFIIFLSALILRGRDLRTAYDVYESPFDGYIVYRVILVGISAFVLMTSLTLRRNSWLHNLFRGLVGCLAIFAIVGVISTAWSVYPTLTLYLSLEYLVDLAVLAAILAMVRSIAEYRHFLNWTWALYGLLVVSAWISSFIWPEVGWNRNVGLIGLQLEGVMPAVAENSLGEYSAILALVAICRLLISPDRRENRAWYWLIVIFGLVTIVFSQTRSAITGFLLGFALLLFFAGRKMLTALVVFSAVLISFTSVPDVLWLYFQRGQTEAQFNNLSSRRIYWERALEKFGDSPLVGFGAYAAGRFAVLPEAGMATIHSLHSDHAEILLGTSIWGTAPFLAALLGSWWVLFRGARYLPRGSLEYRLALEVIAVLAVLSVRSLFTNNLSWHAPQIYLAVVGYAELLRRLSRRTVGRAPQQSSAA